MESHSEQMIDRMNLDKEIEKYAQFESNNSDPDGVLAGLNSTNDYIYESILLGANYVLNNCKLYTEQEMKKAMDFAYHLSKSDDAEKVCDDYIEQNKKK